MTVNKGLLTVDELQMWVFVGLLQVTRFWGISLLGTTFDKKDKGVLRGLPVIFDMDKLQSRCLYATYWEVGVLWCIATSKCPKVSDFLQVCCI